MMRRLLLFFLAILLCSCASKPLKLAPITGDFVATVPKMVVGDRWKYNSKTLDSIVEKEVIAVKKNGDFSLKLTENRGKIQYVECDKNHNILSEKGLAPETNA